MPASATIARVVACARPFRETTRNAASISAARRSAAGIRVTLLLSTPVPTEVGHLSQSHHYARQRLRSQYAPRCSRRRFQHRAPPRGRRPSRRASDPDVIEQVGASAHALSRTRRCDQRRGRRGDHHGRQRRRRDRARSGIDEFLPFATSAIREAANGEEVLARVTRETGVELQVLPGEDEASLTFLAVRRWYGWSADNILLFDIGGGSLELTQGVDEVPDVARSVPLGAGRSTVRVPPRRPAHRRPGGTTARARAPTPRERGRRVPPPAVARPCRRLLEDHPLARAARRARRRRRRIERALRAHAARPRRLDPAPREDPGRLATRTPRHHRGSHVPDRRRRGSALRGHARVRRARSSRSHPGRCARGSSCGGSTSWSDPALRATTST